MNACSKAFTLDADFVWMYTADKTRLVVWKNQRLNSAASMYQAKVQQYNSMYEKLVQDIKSYNENVDRIRYEKAGFNTYVGSFVAGLLPSEIAAAIAADTAAATAKSKKEKDPLVRIYIEYIKKGIQIAILSTFIPTEDRVIIESLPAQLTFDPAIIFKTDDEATTALKAVEVAIIALEEVRSSLNLSSDFEKISFFDVDTGKPRGVGVEKTLLFLKQGTTIKEKKLDNIWESINLEYKPGTRTFSEKLLCRNGTRFNSSWGLDIIFSIYRRLALYNKAYSDSYKLRLFHLFDGNFEKQNNFHIGLNILGLADGIPKPVTRTRGGTRKRRTLRGGAVTTTTRTSSVRPSNRPSTVSHLTLRVRTYEDDFNLAVDDMLSDMYEHLLFLNTIRYETDNLKVLQAFDRCMFNIHGIRMPADIFRTLHYKGQIGGDDNEEKELEEITNVATNAAAAAAAAAGAGAVAGTKGKAVEVTTAAEYQLFQKGDTFATLYSEYEQYLHIVNNMPRLLLRVSEPSRPAEEVERRKALLKAIEEILDLLNAEEMEEFDYKRKYDGKTVIIDKDGAQKEIPDEEAKPRAGAGAVAGTVAGTVTTGMSLATRSQKPTLVPGMRGGFRRRTYKKKRM